MVVEEVMTAEATLLAAVFSLSNGMLRSLIAGSFATFFDACSPSVSSGAGPDAEALCTVELSKEETPSTLLLMMLFTLALAEVAPCNWFADPLHNGACSLVDVPMPTGRAITLSIEFSRVLSTLPVALPVALSPPRCGFFFFAKSYISPNIPANVLRRFFIVSSASSTTDVCPAVPVLLAPDRAADAEETPDTELD